MKRKDVVSILLGVFCIGFLSSVFAYLQGWLYPEANKILGNSSVNVFATIQLIAKLGCIYISCIVGGIVTTWISKTINAVFFVGVILLLIVGWLWLNTIYPIWFWVLLMTGVIPFILLGYGIVRRFTA
jgi:biotin transporter BioY